MRSWMKYLILILLVVAFAGCKAKNPMVGTWALQVSPEMLDGLKRMAGVQSVSGELKCTEDWKFTLTISAAPMVNLNAQGTYSVDEKQVEFTTETANGQKPKAESEKQIGTLDEAMKSLSLNLGGYPLQFVKKP